MRTIYTSIRKALKEQGDFKKIALWREDIANISKEQVFGLPAVFIEFLPIQWKQLSNQAKQGDIALVLHLISSRLDYTPIDDDDEFQSELDRLELHEKLEGVLTSIQRPNGGRAMLLETNLDHSPSELFHDTLSFVFPLVTAQAKKETEQIVNLRDLSFH
ncbi:MAG: hypothetical protein CSB01_01425 [Bacteroidia bacterium]|nr:MAG: hypothetical protein CSB01_01425 [Bacteroidia bacterium]